MTLSMPKRRSSWALRFLFSSSTTRVFRARSMRQLQLFVDQRLGQQVERAGANRLDGRLDGAVAGDQNHDQRGVLLAAMGQQIEAVAVAQSNIEQQHVVGLAARATPGPPPDCRPCRPGSPGCGANRPSSPAPDDRRRPVAAIPFSSSLPRRFAERYSWCVERPPHAAHVGAHVWSDCQRGPHDPHPRHGPHRRQEPLPRTARGGGPHSRPGCLGRSVVNYLRHKMRLVNVAKISPHPGDAARSEARMS